MVFSLEKIPYRTAHKSSKKLYEQCVKLEKLWSHVFTTTVPLTQRDTWYRKLREAIDREQNQAIWVSEAKVIETFSCPIFLFTPLILIQGWWSAFFSLLTSCPASLKKKQRWFSASDFKFFYPVLTAR